MKDEMLNMTQEWDKTFPKSDKVDHKKVTFHNRYGITLAADMYAPKNAGGKLPAIAVCGPFGAVKEQCSGLYAQTLAERGFLTPHLRGKAEDSRDIWLLPTSTRKTLWQRLISSRFRKMSIPTVSVSSASAAGAVWH